MSNSVKVLSALSVRLPEDFTLDKASALLTDEEGGKISPDAKEVYHEILENLEFPRNADQVKKETQAVFQGQLLVLGDSRVGKTSLVKALTGEKFDDKEKRTHGVETKIVDRKWKTQALQDLVFGRFNHFCEEKKQESALLPRIFNKFKYRYGRSHCVENSDREPITWDRLLIEKSGISAIVGDSVLACALVIWMTFVFLAVLLGRWPSRIILMAFEYLFNIFQALSTGIGVKFNLFKYSGVLVGGLLAKCCLAKVFTVPLYSDFTQVFSLAPEGVIREIVRYVVELFILLTTVFVFFIATIFVFCVYDAFRYVYGRLCGRLIANSTHSSISLLLDSVMDITDCLETMVLGGFFVCIRFCLFPVVHIAILTTEVVVAIIFMHLMYLYHQNLHRSRAVIAALVLELALGLGAVIYNIHFCGSVCVLVVAFSLHGYGKWLQIRKFFPGNSFIDVVFRGKIAIKAIVVQKMLKNRKKLKAALDKAFASLKLRILDFAGDKEYYVYHHMFMRKEALYVVVFSIRDYVKDNFQSTDKKLQRLWFWLESVCSHVTPHTPVFLVGTHRGKIKDSTLGTLNSHLRKNLWSVFCDHLVTCKYKGKQFIYFPVENSGGSNDLNGICKLQSAIIRIAHEKDCKANLCVEVPHSWIKVQDAIIDISDSGVKELCWTLKKFEAEMEDICTINSLQKMLEYFHTKGLVIYMDRDPVLSQWVLLKPELLVEIIIQLVNIMPEEHQKRGSRKHWNLLRETGRLSKTLLHMILSRAVGKEGVEPMRRFLEEYDLICPLSHAEHSSDKTSGLPDTHFVPSLLPSAPSVGNQTWCDDPTDVRCYVFFEKFLPEPLFHRLLSRCHKHSQLVYPEGERLLCQGCGLFWLGLQKPYHLKLLKEEGLIEVTFNRNPGVGMLPSEVLSHIWWIVNNICEISFPFLEFHCGPACPSQKCTGAKCKMFHGAWQPIKRRHVFQVLSRPSANARVSFCCLNQSFVTDFEEWIP